MTLRIAIGPEPFDMAAEMVRLEAPGAGAADFQAGAIGCFVGIVRGGGGLVALTLEHYPAMTERAVRRIAEDAQARFGLLGCTVIHRTGRLSPGEPIVLVLALSPHRQAALDATAFLIDWLKTSAPFWKRESFADGVERWVEARADDEAARSRWEEDLAPSS